MLTQPDTVLKGRIFVFVVRFALSNLSSLLWTILALFVCSTQMVKQEKKLRVK